MWNYNRNTYLAVVRFERRIRRIYADVEKDVVLYLVMRYNVPYPCNVIKPSESLCFERRIDSLSSSKEIDTNPFVSYWCKKLEIIWWSIEELTRFISLGCGIQLWIQVITMFFELYSFENRFYLLNITWFWYAILQTKPDESFFPITMNRNSLPIHLRFIKCISNDTHVKKNIFAYLHKYREENPLKQPRLQFFKKSIKPAQIFCWEKCISYNQPPEYGW